MITVGKPHNSFRSLNSQDCRTIYPIVRRNAEKHYKAAAALAQLTDYSNGVAHLILGSEELIKAAMLMLQAYDFPVRDITNYDKLFYNHIPRHNLLKECYAVYVFAAKFIKERPVQTYGQNRAQHWTEVFKHLLIAAKDGIDNHLWWDSADKMKQNCFYVDLVPTGVADPAATNRQQWLTARKFVAAFQKDLNELIALIENATPAALAGYLEDFSAAEFNEVMAESINRKRMNKA